MMGIEIRAHSERVPASRMSTNDIRSFLIEALWGLNGNGLLDRDFESIRRRWQGGSDIEPAVYGATQ